MNIICILQFIISVHLLFILILMLPVTDLFVGGAPPTKSHQAPTSKHQPTENVSKHQETSKPTWLLALEIVTGTMVGSLFIVALLTAYQRCNNKSSLIIPWKKSASEKDQIAIYIG